MTAYLRKCCSFCFQCVSFVNVYQCVRLLLPFGFEGGMWNLIVLIPVLTLCKRNIVSSCQWLVGCFGFNGPLRQYFSLYRAVSQREGEREEKG